MKNIILIALLNTVLLFSIGNAYAEDKIVIAAIFAKSGEAASSNLNHFEGVRFAVDVVNESGGVLGKQIKLLEIDNYSTPIQSKLAAKKAIKANVVAVVGASWSSHSLAMAPTLQRAKIPMISPDSTNPKVTEKGNYIFRTTFTDPVQGKALAKFAHDDLKAKTAVVITNITSTYSMGLSDIFKNNFEKLDGKIAVELEFKNSQHDFKEILTKAIAAHADVIVITGHDESGYIVKQAQELGIESPMIGGDGWAYRQFFSNGGQEMKLGYYTTHWSKNLKSEITQAFVAKYREVYDVSDFAALGYDSLMLIVDAIKRAGSTDRAAIRDALAQTINFPGVTGNITFDKVGNPEKDVVLMKIKNGKDSYYKTIKP